MKTKRIDDMRDYIYENKTVTLDKLCQVFDVSMNTVRRDIKELLNDKNIEKIYGGVTVKRQAKELQPFNERNINNLDKKMAIAKKAAELVEDGDIIFLDSGTTTMHMIQFLSDKKDLTILTNNFEAIMNALKYEDFKIISLSGELNRKTLSFTGNSAAMVLRDYNLNKAFMAATGVSVEGGATNASNAEYNIKRLAVDRSRQVYLLTDHSKFGVVALLTYCTLEQVTGIVSDEEPPAEMKEFLCEKGKEIIIA